MSDGTVEGNKLERIDVNDPCDLADWTTKLGYDADKIRNAVRQVGPIAKNVLKELRRLPQPN